ncbi:MAG: hypothetical protein AAF399_17950 [Bacteroidota bacterium]
MFANLAFFLLTSLGLLLGCWLIFWYRRYNIQQGLHAHLATLHGIQLAYVSPRSFQMFGEYRGYPLQMEAVGLPYLNRKGMRYGFQLMLPMINPNRMALRISKGEAELPFLTQLAPIEKPMALDHGIADWLSIHTNDPMFAGLVLTDDVKITVYEVFRDVPGGVLFMYDEALAMFIPELLNQKSQLKTLGKAVQLLCDMKDELNH